MKKNKKKRSSKVLEFFSPVIFKFRTPALKHLRTSSCFTLIELISAMAIFTVLMLVMMRFFGSAQEAWTKSASRSMIYDNARVAMDLMSKDLQSAFYAKDITPFANYAAPLNKIAFISSSNLRQNDEATSPYSEVQYELGTGTDDGWLMRSVTSNIDDGGAINSNCNYTEYPNPTNFNKVDNTIFDDASRETPNRVIPYVTELTFETFDLTGNPILKSGETPAKNADDFTNFPGIVKIKLSLLDKNSWKKWEAMGALPSEASDDSDGTAAGLGVDPKKALLAFRKNAERTFTKMIFLGNRGQ